MSGQLEATSYSNLGWVVVPTAWHAKAPVVRDWKKLLRPDLCGFKDEAYGPATLLELYSQMAEETGRAVNLTGWYMPLNMGRREGCAYPVVIDSEGKHDADREGWDEALRIGWEAGLPCWRSSGTVAAGPTAEGAGRLPNMMLLLKPIEVRWIAGLELNPGFTPANIKLAGAGEILAGGAGVNLPPSRINVNGRIWDLEELIPCCGAFELRRRTEAAAKKGMLEPLRVGAASAVKEAGRHPGVNRPEVPWLVSVFRIEGWEAGLAAAAERVKPGERWYATKTIAGEYRRRELVARQEGRLDAVLRVMRAIWAGSPEEGDVVRVWEKALRDEDRWMMGAR